MEQQSGILTESIINKTSVLEAMRPYLSAEALSLMSVKAPELVQAGVNVTCERLMTPDGALELLTLGIRTRRTHLEDAIKHMAVELNSLASQGLWNSTLEEPVFIELDMFDIKAATLALCCFVLVPADKVELARSGIKSYVVNDELYSLE